MLFARLLCILVPQNNVKVLDEKSERSSIGINSKQKKDSWIWRTAYYIHVVYWKILNFTTKCLCWLNAKFLSCQHSLGTLFVNEPIPFLLWLLPWLFPQIFHDILFLLFIPAAPIPCNPLFFLDLTCILVYTAYTAHHTIPTTTSCSSSSAFCFSFLPSFLFLIFFSIHYKNRRGNTWLCTQKRYIIMLHACK